MGSTYRGSASRGFAYGGSAKGVCIKWGSASRGRGLHLVGVGQTPLELEKRVVHTLL